MVEFLGLLLIFFVIIVLASIRQINEYEYINGIIKKGSADPSL